MILMMKILMKGINWLVFQMKEYFGRFEVIFILQLKIVKLLKSFTKLLKS